MKGKVQVVKQPAVKMSSEEIAKEMKEIQDKRREREEIRFQKDRFNAPKDELLGELFGLSNSQGDAEDFKPWTLEEISIIFDEEKDTVVAFNKIREEMEFTNWGKNLKWKQ
jgi:hypothetical protein